MRDKPLQGKLHTVGTSAVRILLRLIQVEPLTQRPMLTRIVEPRPTRRELTWVLSREDGNPIETKAIRAIDL